MPGGQHYHAGVAAGWRDQPAHVRVLVRLAGVDRHRAIAEHVIDVLRAGEHPLFDLLITMDRLALAQEGEYRMRVGAKRRIEGRELDARGDTLRGIRPRSSITTLPPPRTRGLE